MNRKVIFFAVLLITCLAFTVYAADKKDPSFLNKIKIDPNTLKEKQSGADVVPEKATVTQDYCDTLSYHGDYQYYFSIPDPYGDDFFNERFDIPYDCYLKEIRIAFYEEGSSGNPDASVLVWRSDGTYPLDPAPPSGAIAEFVIPHADIVWYPDWNVIDCEIVELELTGGEPIHIGFSHPGNPGDTLSVLSDDGSNNSTRSIEYWAEAWSTILDDWEIGVDFLIEAVICADTGGVGCCQFADGCENTTEEKCEALGGTWYRPPHECFGRHCVYVHDLPQTTIVEPNDTSIWDKNYFSDTLAIQAIDFQAISTVESTAFEYFHDGTWHLIDTDYDGTTYMQDPWDTLQPGGDGWHAEWYPEDLPEGYYVIRATMYDSDGDFASDTIVQYYDPYPPEVSIIWPDVFNFLTDSLLDIHFFTPGNNIIEMYIIVYPVPDYPGPEGVKLGADKFDCIQGYNKGVPHFNQNHLYPDGSDGNNRGCSPTAMAACLKYWAENGFPCLNDSGKMTDSQMVAEIADSAGTHPDHGTAVKKKKPAIEAYIKKHCGECVFQPVEHLQGKDVTLKRLIKELFEEGEDVITGDVGHVTVVNSFCLHPKKFIDYMDPATGAEVNGPLDVSKGFYGRPLIELVIVSPKETTVTVPPDTVAFPEDIEEVEPGTYHYPWKPDPELFPVARAYFVNVEITDVLGHRGWDLVKVELFLCGDPNNDGGINLADVICLATYIFGKPCSIVPEASDVNCDGSIDLVDVILIAQYSFGQPIELNCCP